MKRINKYSFFLLALLLCNPIQIKAHEEPAKTLKEKKEKAEKRQQVLKSKIKIATVWKYVYEKENEQPIKHKAFVMGYDEKGNFSFIEGYKNDSLTERDEYSYSATGDMLSEIDHTPQGMILEKSFFTFDTDGRVVSGESKTNSDSLTGYFNITSGKDKKSMVFNKYNAHDSIEYRLVYSYSEDFDKCDYTEAYKYDPQSRLIMKVEKKFNPQGLQTKKAIFDNGQKLSYYFLYEYDNAGNNTRITKKSANDTVEWVDYYSYDKNGNCTGLKSYDHNMTLKSSLVYEYEYYQ